MINRPFFSLLFLLSFLYWGAFAQNQESLKASTDATEVPEANSPFISPADIKVGDLLDSRTRMSNNEMYDFKLKVLSILKSSDGGIGGKDDWFVMANVEDDVISKSGVLAGMSGSPVYYQGRLLGAIAYSDSFQKEPRLIIRSIYSMLRLKDFRARNKKNEAEVSTPSMTNLKPVQTPLFAGGGFYLSQQDVKETLGQDYVFLQGSVDGSADGTTGSDHLVPGDAMGVGFVLGDMNVYALGTVTYVEGNQILAFGHPMFSKGTTRMPLFSAKVDTIVPKLTISYKVGTLGKEIGSIVEDRNMGILGEYDVKSSFADVSVDMTTTVQDRVFHFQIVNSDGDLFSDMLSMVIFNSLKATESDGQKGVSLSYELSGQLRGVGTPVSFSGHVGIPEAPVNSMGNLAISDVRSKLSRLFTNPFEKVSFEKVDVKVDVHRNQNNRTVIGLSADKQVYKPGETVGITLLLRKGNEEVSYRKVAFPLPEEAPEGNYEIRLDYEGVVSQLEKYLENSPRNIDEYVASLNRESINMKRLVLYSFDQNNATFYGEKHYSGLPEVYYHVMTSQPSLKIMGPVESGRTLRNVTVEDEEAFSIDPGLAPKSIVIQIHSEASEM